MKVSEFDYELPKELIAQYPLKDRLKARLMVLERKASVIRDRAFEDIGEYLREGDALVLNDTKVIPARLFGKRKSGGRVEIFLLTALEKNSLAGPENKNHACEALLKPSGRLREGERLVLESGDEAEILDRGIIGRRVKFDSPVDEILERCGHTPLPPYIKRADTVSDREDYQTVYAKNAGATASPTAGLHFTSELLGRIRDRGVRICYVTLHTSYGTFAPVKVEDIENHKMHVEYFNMPKETAAIVSGARKQGGRVFAVGTTSTRVLEHCFDTRYEIRDTRYETGYTGLFIYPSYRFKIVDCLITNFHLPRSTLLMLVSAFAGKDFIFDAYRRAIKEQYRFFSYGDAMLVI